MKLSQPLLNELLGSRVLLYDEQFGWRVMVERVSAAPNRAPERRAGQPKIEATELYETT